MHRHQPHWITFYSFKGGVGRTTALVNLAFALARRGMRMLLWDLDLEAPGFTEMPVFSRIRDQIAGGTLDLLIAPQFDDLSGQLARSVVEFRDEANKVSFP